MQISTKSSRRDELEFLPAALEIVEAPPAPFGRILAFSISAFFILVIVWASLGTVDVVAVAQGRTIPTGNIKVVQPLETGVIRSIHVTEGQHVVAGELLIELDPTDATANVEILRLDLAQARLEAALGNALLSETPLQNFTEPADVNRKDVAATKGLLRDMFTRHKSSLQAFDSEISRQQAAMNVANIETDMLSKTIPITREQLDAKKLLYRNKIVSKTEVSVLKQTLYEQEARLNTAMENKAQAVAAIDSLLARKLEKTATFRESAALRRREALRQIASVSHSIFKEEQRQRYRRLIAPVSGVVHQLSVHTVGAVVNPAEQLLTLVPAETPLEIEAFVLNKDIGFLSVGLPVEIKYEAFPFTRYGITAGTLAALSSDAVIDESLGPVYKATVKLNSQSVQADGRRINLSPGMLATVEVKTGTRKIIDFFLSPLLRYKDEAIRER